MQTLPLTRLPTIAIIGRPNVGKSTLFNALTRSRDALVADEPGITRDRQFGRGQVGERDYWLIDTGGLADNQDAMANYISEQAWLAVQEADRVLFVVDGREGLTAADQLITEQLRNYAPTVHLVVNKTEGQANDLLEAEFHRQGIQALMEAVLSDLPALPTTVSSDITQPSGIQIAVVGRPNVGKSTLVNRILGEERVIAFDQPGTTRDSIAIPFTRRDRPYTLIDTAGVRRRARVQAGIEKFSVIKTLQAIDAAHVVIALLDAQEGMTDQDANLLGLIDESGRALVIAMNKWDGLDDSHRQQVQYQLDRKLHFLDYAKVHFISALHGSGVGSLFSTIHAAYQAATRQISTPRLNQVLQDAVEQHQPPLRHGRRIKLRYIHQAGQNPPKFIIHGNQLDALPAAYKRYLGNVLREVFKLEGTPIRLTFKQGENPFQGRKNTLTQRQVQKRQRLIRHVKRR